MAAEKHVYVCEKPSLARALFSGLGGSESQIKEGNKKGFWNTGDHYVVTCFGHMLEQLQPHEHDPKYKTWDMNLLPMHTPHKLKVRADVKAKYNIIKDHLKDATTVYNVGDIDEEGQRLCDEIFEFENISVPKKRIQIADYNLAVVKKAILNAEDNSKHESKGDAALARSLSDYSFGLNLTRAFTLAGRKKGLSTVIPIGRVQTAIINLVNERCIAIENHKPKTFYDLTGNFNINNVDFVAKYKIKETDQVNADGKIDSKTFADSIEEKCLDEEATITDAVHKDIDKFCPAPHSLTSISSECAKKYKISGKETLAAIQNLYETHHLLTYPRSTSRNLGNGHFENKEEIFNAIKKNSSSLNGLVDGANSTVKHKAFNDEKVKVHHAIIPTSAVVDFSKLTDIEKKIYNLISLSYVALFYPPSVYSSSEVSLKVADLQFSVKSESRKVEGWETLYKKSKSEEDKVKSNLFDLKSGDKGLCNGLNIEPKQTTPPKYYVESTLGTDLTKAVVYVKDQSLKKEMLDKFKGEDEQGGIGTTATRAGILDALFERGFLRSGELKGYNEKVIVTSKLAKDILKIVPPSCKEVDLTAKWLSMGMDIINGKMTVDEYCNTVFTEIKKEVENIKQNGIDIKVDLDPCPVCKVGYLKLIKTEKSTFFGCTNHPDCKTIYSEYKGKAFTKTHLCPDCGKPLALRNGKKGYFFGCTGYEDGCKTVFDCKNGEPVKAAKKKKSFSKRK